MVMVLFIGLADGLFAQQYEITSVEYLGDFIDSGPLNRAVNAAVAKYQRQNPGFTFTIAEGFNHFEMKMIVDLWEEELSEKVNIDSLWVVFVTPRRDITNNKYIILFQGWPMAVNPYAVWLYRGRSR
ncbi:MAG: hypothetical protein LBH26_02825 [Treponema sp.]|jgi:hypothetical protein|nr:hypothetical protein [Treponema sp.]